MESENLKKQLIFACEWYYNRKKSWSGTHLSIFNALKKYYDVENFNMGLGNVIPVAFEKIASQAGITLHFSKNKREKMSAIAQKRFYNSNIPIFQFGILPDVKGSKSFVYQDLNWIFLERLAEYNSFEFRNSGFQRFSLHEIKENADRQRDFYQKENCAAVLAMGKWYESFLINECHLPGDKVYHIGGGCNLNDSLIDGREKEGNKILFVGKAFERKNGPLVVEAFKILKRGLPEAELYIAGPKKLNIGEAGIYCLGELNSSQLANYFNLCDVFCMPSIFEAYGLVFAEALTYGLPCIGRNAYEMSYFIEEGETGYLLRSQSAEELAKLMRFALENTQMKKNVLCKRQFYLEEYSWDSVARRATKIMDAMG